MDIRQLSYFVEVAQQQSFTKAAQKLNISQPALSKCISNLEEELNISLFTRSIGHITLTEEGQYVLDNATELLTCYNEIAHKLYHLKSQSNTSLTIGCSIILHSLIGINFLESVCTQYDIKINAYSEGSLNQLLESVYKGKLDLAIAILCDENNAYKNKVDIDGCFCGRFVAISAQGVCDHIEYFEDLKLPQKVISTCEFSSVFLNQNVTEQLHMYYFTDSISESLKMVLEKNFIAIIPDIFVPIMDQKIHIMEFKDEKSYEIVLIMEKSKRKSKTVQIIKKGIVSMIKKQLLLE